MKKSIIDQKILFDDYIKKKSTHKSSESNEKEKEF